MKAERNNKGQFVKGNSGRPKGSVNKQNKEIRLFLSELVNENKDMIVDDLNSLEPSERIKLIVDLIKFILPKLQPVNDGIYKSQDEKLDWFND